MINLIKRFFNIKKKTEKEELCEFFKKYEDMKDKTSRVIGDKYYLALKLNRRSYIEKELAILNRLVEEFSVRFYKDIKEKKCFIENSDIKVNEIEYYVLVRIDMVDYGFFIQFEQYLRNNTNFKEVPLYDIVKNFDKLSVLKNPINILNRSNDYCCDECNIEDIDGVPFLTDEDELYFARIFDYNFNRYLVIGGGNVNRVDFVKYIHKHSKDTSFYIFDNQNDYDEYEKVERGSLNVLSLISDNEYKNSIIIDAYFYILKSIIKRDLNELDQINLKYAISRAVEKEGNTANIEHVFREICLMGKDEKYKDLLDYASPVGDNKHVLRGKMDIDLMNKNIVFNSLDTIGTIAYITKISIDNLKLLRENSVTDERFVIYMFNEDDIVTEFMMNRILMFLRKINGVFLYSVKSIKDSKTDIIDQHYFSSTFYLSEINESIIETGKILPFGECIVKEYNSNSIIKLKQLKGIK